MPTILPRFLTFFQALFRGFADHPPGARPPSELVLRLQRFLNWTAHRLPRALERAQHGWTPPPPRPPPRPASPPKSERAQATAALPLPRREAWLIGCVPVSDRRYLVAAYRSQLQHLLSDPDLAPLLASPPLHRLLRPLCRMLGISHCLPPPQPPSSQPPSSQQPVASTCASPAPSRLVTPAITAPNRVASHAPADPPLKTASA